MEWDYNSDRSGAHLRYRGYTAWARRTGDGMIFDATGAVAHRVFRSEMADVIAAIEDYLNERRGVIGQRVTTIQPTE